MTMDVLDDDNRVVDDQADAEDQRQKGQEIDRIAESEERDHHADE